MLRTQGPLSFNHASALLKALAIGVVFYIVLLSTGCTGCSSKGNPVTGTDGPTSGAGQSETAISVQGYGDNTIITVTYNDETGNGPKIVYTSTQRTVYSGASLMGWSYSADHGDHWTYGGKVTPPSNWPILWGDPAITASRVRPNYVFISNLAVPQTKYPSAGIVSTKFGSGFYTALGGACIARSTDTGKTFSFMQCVHRSSYDFYDGGTMAAGQNGEIYAAYVDVSTSQIDVWRSPDENGTFAMLPDPFPGISIVTHARLRTWLDGSLYVAATSSVGDVVINRYANGAWGQPRAACNNVMVYPTINLSDRTLRTGPQFSFDVASPSINGNDEVRVVCTTRDSQTGRLFLETSACSLNLSGCINAAGWSTSTANSSGYRGDQFNPVLQAFPGFLSIAPVWKLTFLSRENDPSGNTVSVQQGNLAVLPDSQRILIEFDLVPGQVICPDNRGYWGDYDDVQIRGFTTTYPEFIRSETDSTAGCTERWDVTSEQVHVSSTKID
jgi:hypothetical protein